jgi:hypothetical protein
MNQVLIKIISDSDNQTPNPNASEGGNANGKPDPRAKKTKKKKSDSQIMAIYFARKAYYLAKGQATQCATKYFNASEMYKEKIMVDNAMSTIDFGVDLFSAGITGAKYGGVAGFFIGTTFAALAKGVQRFNELSNETQKLIDSSYGNYFNATRAGFVAGGHNTEN